MTDNRSPQKRRKDRMRVALEGLCILAVVGTIFAAVIVLAMVANDK
jgi:succinate dehydrogenase hydrophobic anchor subunit